MRILHFVETYVQPTETFVCNFIKKSAESHSIAIICFNKVDNFSLMGIQFKPDVYRLSKMPSSKKSISGLYWYLMEKCCSGKPWYLELKRVLSEFRPDLVHCHFGTVGVEFMKFSERYKVTIPFICSFYGFDATERPRKDKQYSAALQTLWQKIRFVLVEGPALAEKIMKLGCAENKIRISPISINVSHYPVKLNPKIDINNIRFLVIGRFVEKKGFHLFFEALGQLAEKNNCKVTVIGDGKLDDLYKSIIAKYDFSDNVDFLGLRSLDECKNYIVNSDFLVHPSLEASDGDSEGGAPTIIIEAQAMRLPVITSNHADIPYIMGYDDLMCEENDIESLKRVLLKIFNSEVDYAALTDAGFRKVTVQHNLDNEVYTNLLTQAVYGE